MPVAVLFVHGIEIASAEYATNAHRLLDEAVRARTGRPADEVLVVGSALYGQAFQAGEDELLERVVGSDPEPALVAWFSWLRDLALAADQGRVRSLLALGLSAAARTVRGVTAFRWPTLRWALVQYVGDAVAYQPAVDGREVFDEVQGHLLDALASLAERAGPDAPLVVVAHSLGSVVVTDLLLDLQADRDPARSSRLADGSRARLAGSALARGETLAQLWTLGSPIALWSLRTRAVPVPVTVPDPEWSRRHPDAPGGWVNLYDGDDVVATRLGCLSEAFAAQVRDEEVVLRPWWLSWTPAAHPFYWNDVGVMDRIAGDVVALSRAVAPAAQHAAGPTD